MTIPISLDWTFLSEPTSRQAEPLELSPPIPRLALRLALHDASQPVAYLRDLAEDFARIESQAATWGEQLILGFRVYLNKSSHQANEGIKVLTGLTALTMPPILIGGWFGMNFARMPELAPPWTYPLAAVLTLAATGALFWFLRRRRWL